MNYKLHTSFKNFVSGRTVKFAHLRIKMAACRLRKEQLKRDTIYGPSCFN
jgi:hypothetical protein